MNSYAICAVVCLVSSAVLLSGCGDDQADVKVGRTPPAQAGAKNAIQNVGKANRSAHYAELIIDDTVRLPLEEGPIVLVGARSLRMEALKPFEPRLGDTGSSELKLGTNGECGWSYGRSGVISKSGDVYSIAEGVYATPAKARYLARYFPYDESKARQDQGFIKPQTGPKIGSVLDFYQHSTDGMFSGFTLTIRVPAGTLHPEPWSWPEGLLAWATMGGEDYLELQRQYTREYRHKQLTAFHFVRFPQLVDPAEERFILGPSSPRFSFEVREDDEGQVAIIKMRCPPCPLEDPIQEFRIDLGDWPTRSLTIFVEPQYEEKSRSGGSKAV